jgi:hypothetical protein
MYKLKEYRARPHDLKGVWEVYQYNPDEDDWELVEEYKFIDEEDCANQYLQAVFGMRRLERAHV